MSSPPPSLPSPTYLALTFDGRTKDVSRQWLDSMAAEIEAGRWPFNPAEVHPGTGLGLVQALVRTCGMLSDQVRDAALEKLVAWGCDIDQAAPDGTTAWEWALSSRLWDIARKLEQLGCQTRPDVQRALPRELAIQMEGCGMGLGDGWRSPSQLVQALLSPEGFGTLDATASGVPLGVLPVWNRLRVNGANLLERTLSPGTTREQAMDRILEFAGSLGKEALKAAPGSDFPLWCWLCQAQFMFYAPDAPSPARHRKWLATWASLEKAIVRARYPRQPAAEAAALLGRDVRQLAVATMQAFFDAGKNPLRIQGFAGFVLLGLRAWANRPEEDPSLPAARRAELWSTAAALVEHTPEKAWEIPNFASRWASPAHYALDPDLRRLPATPADSPPEWLASPHFTLPAVLSTSHDTQQQGLYVAWLLQSCRARADLSRVRAMLSHSAPLLARIDGQALEAVLGNESAPGLRPRM